jgi:hypothetical protein
MPVEQICLSIKRGDTWTRPIYFQDENGNAKDITGWKIYFLVKAKIDDLDSAAVISKIITVFSDPINGEAWIELTSTDTNLLGNYLFACKVITPNMIGITKEGITVLEGIITFTDRVVQAVD